MPLYEYECKQCGHRFEKIMKFSDAPLKECPKCGGEVEQLLSAPAVQFKGSGWYVTDYAKKSGGSAAKPAVSGDSATASSDSKPADAAKTSDSKSTTPETKLSTPAKKSEG